METYKVVRYYFKGSKRRVIRRGLTLEQAQQHCASPETSSTTATTPNARALTRKRGPWFEGYTKE